MSIYIYDKPLPKFLRTTYEVHTRHNGYPQPFYDGAATANQAREIAEQKARALNLPVVHINWKHDFRDVKNDGVFICEIRKDQMQPGWPRVFA
jgi:hypothetical protein